MANMKVDIIYYQIPADFEMEFNLSGCCPMRMLKSAAYTKRDYIEGLARAVSRSKIIIACGPVYGEEGIIQITSKATHRPTVIINNADYGIAQDLNVEIIENSVPLVTTSGLFGGLIIESGSQTIILLSENKDIRKNVMQNLIHAYVRDVSIVEIKRNSGSSVLGAAPAESSTEEENSEILTPEDFENLPEAGEVVDFSKEDIEEAQDEDEAAPSDEALAAVAREINDLSSEIGKALYENDNTENRETEEPAEAEGGEGDENAQEAAAEAEPSEEHYEIELSDEAFVFEEDEEAEDAEITPLKRTAPPQIDFSIDHNEEDAGEESAVSVANFLFEEGQDDAPGYYGGEPKEEIEDNAPFDTQQSLDYAYVLDDDGEEPKSKHKSLVRNILIIAGILAVILLVLAYYFIYVPKSGGTDPLDYIKSFFAGSVNFFMWRG